MVLPPDVCYYQVNLGQVLKSNVALMALYNIISNITNQNPSDHLATGVALSEKFVSPKKSPVVKICRQFQIFGARFKHMSNNYTSIWSNDIN